MKMTHSAKRINAGNYGYRGWAIVKMDYGWVTFETTAKATDVCVTLLEAKALINYYLDEMEI